MIHLTEMESGSSLKSQLQFLMMPEIYKAMSIHDFVTDRKKIQGTTFLKSLLLKSTAYYSLYREGDAVIYLQNINYYSSSSEGEDLIELHDSSSAIAISVFDQEYHPKELIRQGIRDGDRIQRATILYNVKTDGSHLLYLNKIDHRPAASKQAESLDGLLTDGMLGVAR